MWADNETHVDLLGFDVHKNLITAACLKGDRFVKLGA